MKITVLGGAGLMGQGIVRDLLSDRAIVGIAEVVVCDRSHARLDMLAERLVDPRLRVRVLDVTDARAVAACLQGSDICLNAVPTLAGHQMTIFAAALEARVPYVDLGGLGRTTVEQKKWHDRFVAAGCTAVLGAGADPGMSNVICRLVADRLDRVDRISLYWAAELTGPESPVLSPPYALSTILAEYAHPSTQFLDGRHVEVPPMSGREVIALPAPWGDAEFMHSPHSEQLTVPVADGIREKGIRDFTWKLHLPRREHEAWVGLVRAGFGDDEPVEVDGVTVSPLAVLDAVIQRNLDRRAAEIPAQESHEIHFAIASGTKDGMAREVRCDVIVRPDEMYEPYVDAATSMNASIAVQLILTQPLRPGVWAPEEYFAVDAYVAELQKRRFAISVTTRNLGDDEMAPPVVEHLTGKADAA